MLFVLHHWVFNDCKLFFLSSIYLLQELLCRTTLESQKLELMSELSNLKLKLNSIEKERLDFDERFSDSEVCERSHRTGILIVSPCIHSAASEHTDMCVHPHTIPTTPNKHSFTLSDTCVGQGLLMFLPVSKQLCVKTWGQSEICNISKKCQSKLN